MFQSSKLSSLINRFRASFPLKQTVILRLQQGGIGLSLLAGVYLFVPPLWNAISVSLEQRVEPLKQRIANLDKQIKTSSTPSTTDLKEIAILEKGRIDTEHSIRTTIIQATVGFLGTITVFIAWKQWQAAQEKQVAERFSKAVEQLGSENNIHARLGGIYALEQIAKDAEEKYYWQVMETLTSYVRERSPYLPKDAEQLNLGNQPSPETPEEIPSLTTDIQAVMTVLARRKHHYGHRLESHPLDLRRVDLRNLELPPNTNMQGAYLTEANLQEVYLTEVNLEGANLGKVNLEGAHLIKANLQRAHLGEANLQKAYLTNANLQEAYLEEANLQGAYLIKANLQEAYLVKANLEEAQLRKVNLQGAQLMKANLKGAHLGEANLEGANLWEANLEGAKFKILKPKVTKQLREGEAIGLTWEQINQAATYTKEMLPDYLLQQIPEVPTAVTEAINPAMSAAESPQHEAEVEQKGDSAAS